MPACSVPLTHLLIDKVHNFKVFDVLELLVKVRLNVEIQCVQQYSELAMKLTKTVLGYNLSDVPSLVEKLKDKVGKVLAEGEEVDKTPSDEKESDEIYETAKESLESDNERGEENSSSGESLLCRIPMSLVLNVIKGVMSRLRVDTLSESWSSFLKAGNSTFIIAIASGLFPQNESWSFE